MSITVGNQPTDVGYFGLLDALVVIAEAWKVLLVAVLIAIAAGFGYYQFQPKTYQSDAIFSLDAAQLARFSSPDFLIRSGVENAMWQFELNHAAPSGDESLRLTYAASFRAGSAQEAQAGLQALIHSFSTEFAPDAVRVQALERSRERLAKSLAELDTIASKLAGEVDTTLPGSESELYSRSVVMLLDTQWKRENELAAVEAELASGSGSFVLVPPSLPDGPIVQSVRPVLLASIGVAVFLVLSTAFVREAVRRAGQTPAGAEKLRRLRNAFRLRPRSQR